MKSLSLAAALPFVLFPSAMEAKCARNDAYYCVTGTFEKERPDLVILGAKHVSACVGSLKLDDKTVTVAFEERQQCPAPGEKVQGHLRPLCQDTGEWTKAQFTFARGHEAFCGRSPDQAARLSERLAAGVKPGMKRGQVREILGELQLLSTGFDEEFYLHPDTVLRVGFDEPRRRLFDGQHRQAARENPSSGAAPTLRGLTLSPRILPCWSIS